MKILGWTVLLFAMLYVSWHLGRWHEKQQMPVYHDAVKLCNTCNSQITLYNHLYNEVLIELEKQEKFCKKKVGL